MKFKKKIIAIAAFLLALSSVAFVGCSNDSSSTGGTSTNGTSTGGTSTGGSSTGGTSTGGGSTDIPDPVVPDEDVILDMSLDYNDDAYAPENCNVRSASKLKGKTVYWLGSSVFEGQHSHKTGDKWDGTDSMVEYIAVRNDMTCVKDTKSGTLFGSKTYTAPPVDSANSYVNRLISSEKFDREAEIDAFICQISTNDAQYSASDPDLIGTVSANDVTDRDEFDLQTSLGSVEYIISYVHDTWNCPVYFISGSYYGADKFDGEREVSYNKGVNYANLLSGIEDVVEKWNAMDGYEVEILDQYNDDEFNNVDTDHYNYYMTDPIHPSRAGYLFWWTPNIEAFLEAKIGTTVTYPYQITIDSSGGVTDSDGDTIYKDGSNYNVDKNGNVYADPGTNAYGSGSFDRTVNEWAVDTGSTRGTNSYGGGAVIVTFDKTDSSDETVELYYTGDVYNNGNTAMGCSATFKKDGTCTLIYSFGPYNYTYAGTWAANGNIISYTATAQ